MEQLITVINRFVPRQKLLLTDFKTFQCPCFKYTQHQPLRQLPHASILQSLSDPTTLQQLHACVITSGLSQSLPLCNRLMNSYASFGLISDTQKIFYLIPKKNIFSWTILISGLTKNYLFVDAVDAFGKMVTVGLMPNEVTIASILPAFGKLGLHQLGKSVHCLWVRRDFGHNIVVETSLVDMYCRFGCVGAARKLFDKMPERSLGSWNVIISGYAKNSCGSEAIFLFNLMHINGISADYFTIMSLISASLSTEYLGTGPLIHGFTIKTGYADELQIKTALVNMYICSKFFHDAYSVFIEMSCKDVVAWTMMLAGLSSAKYWNKAIDHFNEMRRIKHMVLDSVAFVGILSICSCSGALQHGRTIHALVQKTGFCNDVFVGSALIKMFASCGELDNAKLFFQEMEEKDAACWNALISAVGINGLGDDAVDLFLQMKGFGNNPNDSTFVSVLCACSHAGMVDEGLHIFDHMVEKWGVIPNLQHYACVVDLLGRSGRLDDAYSFIGKMSLQTHPGVYGSLLGACRVYGNTHIGAEIFQKLSQLETADAGHFCCLSNLYASVGNWEGVEMTQVSLRSKLMKKDPGNSLVEIN